MCVCKQYVSHREGSSWPLLKYNAFSDRPATLELGYCVYKDFRPLIAGLNGSRFHSVFGIQLRRSFRRSLTRYIWLPLSNRTFYASGKQSDKFALLIMLIRPYFKLFSPVSSLVCMYAAKTKITHLWVYSFYHTHVCEFIKLYNLLRSTCFSGTLLPYIKGKCTLYCG